MEHAFDVHGMHCASCEVLLVDVIGEMAGVERVSVNRMKGKVIVNVRDRRVLDAVKQTIEKEGYKVGK